MLYTVSEKHLLEVENFDINKDVSTTFTHSYLAKKNRASKSSQVNDVLRTRLVTASMSVSQ